MTCFFHVMSCHHHVILLVVRPIMLNIKFNFNIYWNSSTTQHPHQHQHRHVFVSLQLFVILNEYKCNGSELDGRCMSCHVVSHVSCHGMSCHIACLLRFDHIITMSPPSPTRRSAILQHLLTCQPQLTVDMSTLPTSSSTSTSTSHETLCQHLASLTPGYLARDLYHVMNHAMLYAYQRTTTTTTTPHTITITWQDWKKALQQTRPARSMDSSITGMSLLPVIVLVFHARLVSWHVLCSHVMSFYHIMHSSTSLCWLCYYHAAYQSSHATMVTSRNSITFGITTCYW